MGKKTRPIQPWRPMPPVRPLRGAICGENHRSERTRISAGGLYSHPVDFCFRVVVGAAPRPSFFQVNPSTFRDAFSQRAQHKLTAQSTDVSSKSRFCMVTFGTQVPINTCTTENHVVVVGSTLMSCITDSTCIIENTFSPPAVPSDWQQELHRQQHTNYQTSALAVVSALRLALKSTGGSSNERSRHRHLHSDWRLELRPREEGGREGRRREGGNRCIIDTSLPASALHPVW